MYLHTADTAIYGRLSKEDSRFKDQSGSIETQLLFLQSYADENGLQVYDRYTDDGYTGTNFQRPAFMRMMEDIKAGKIKTVLIKDLSRLGRDYIESGRYMETVFPEYGIRLIAPGDGYDSENGDGNDLAPVRNVFNDFFPRDISKKTRAAVRARAQAGLYVGSGAYGYMKEPDNKNHVIPNPDTAPVVHRIFSMVASGFGYLTIARTLSNEGVPTPSAYKGRSPKSDLRGSTDWSMSTVRQILNSEVYLGKLVYGKTKKLNYKSSKILKMPKEAQVVIENTHEPLVSQELWDLAHKVNGSRNKPTGDGTPHIFSGLLYCFDCKDRVSRATKGTFTCQRYRCYGDCTSSHYTTLERLSATVLASIREVTENIKVDKQGFIARLSGRSQSKQQAACNAQKKERDKLEKRLAELPTLTKKLFEKNAAGVLDDEVFKSIMQEYTEERRDLQSRLDALNAVISEMEQAQDGVNQFVTLVERYTDIQELDRDIIHTLIDKIEIHSAYKDEFGVKIQEVDIYFRFVGKL